MLRLCLQYYDLHEFLMQVSILLQVYDQMIRYLTTNDHDASRLLIPSVKPLMLLLSKISLANADAVAIQATVVQLYCALLCENIRTEDDADDMQVRTEVAHVCNLLQLTHFRPLAAPKFSCG